MQYVTIDIGLLERDPDQPRKSYYADDLTKAEKESLDQLAGSIKAQGVFNPILVVPLGAGRYRIVAGERRWRAAAIAGIEKIPCFIPESGEEAESESERLAIQISENLMREDLSDFDVGEGLARLRAQGMSRNEIAELLGQNPPWVSTRMTFHRERESNKMGQAGITSAEVWSKFRRLRPDQQNRLVAHREETGEPITSGLIQRVHKEGVAPEQYSGPTHGPGNVQQENEDEGEVLSFAEADEWAEEGQVIDREAKEVLGSARGPQEGDQPESPDLGSGYAPVARGEPDPEEAFEGFDENSALDAFPESEVCTLWYSFGFEPDEWAALARFCGVMVDEIPDRDTIKTALKYAIQQAP